MLDASFELEPEAQRRGGRLKRQFAVLLKTATGRRCRGGRQGDNGAGKEGKGEVVFQTAAGGAVDVCLLLAVKNRSEPFEGVPRFKDRLGHFTA